MEKDDIKPSGDKNETLQELVKVKLNSNSNSVRMKCGKYVYGRTCLDGYLTKKLGICPLLYFHIGDY